MLTHKDFDFDSMKSKTLDELTKEEKEYISKYVSTIKYEELDSSLAELGDKYYIYFS